TQTGGACVQGDLAHGRVVIAQSGQVERIYRMAGRLQAVHQWSPDPCAGERTVYEEKSGQFGLPSVDRSVSATGQLGRKFSGKQARGERKYACRMYPFFVGVPQKFTSSGRPPCVVISAGLQIISKQDSYRNGLEDRARSSAE